MGTPEFAVASLDILIQHNYNVVAVITVPDKPAGRGQQLQQSAVKKYALEKKLNILQPEKLKNETFLAELKALNADLQIVVAFRMLPEVVWNMPPKGTVNLHGSLLPQYRGAAPINWAIINGEKETGVTTFFLQHEIDTGKIIFRETITVGEIETAGDVHDKLMEIGASLILKTVQSIENNNFQETEQSKLIVNESELKHAPKIFKEDCKINWNKSVQEIYNFIRGLSPYPTAFTAFVLSDDKKHIVKIFKTEKEIATHNFPISTVVSDSKTYIKIALADGFIKIIDLQLAGKKRMLVDEFLRGFKIDSVLKVV